VSHWRLGNEAVFLKEREDWQSGLSSRALSSNPSATKKINRLKGALWSFGPAWVIVYSQVKQGSRSCSEPVG
jgi:hypothetical protein